jgi:hypothetical protein
LLAFAAGIRMEDDKERNRSDDDAGDDDEQKGAAEGWSFVGRRDGGGCHGWLDAECTKVRFFLMRWSGVLDKSCKRVMAECFFLMM